MKLSSRFVFAISLLLPVAAFGAPETPLPSPHDRTAGTANASAAVGTKEIGEAARPVAPQIVTRGSQLSATELAKYEQLSAQTEARGDQPAAGDATQVIAIGGIVLFVLIVGGAIAYAAN